ncbi:glycine cleavage system protein H [Mobiluncus mulieris]|uniref:glycine cleavage system protein H n=1 Tax=Mobiluncus mulieris TaxID=2052 RepID=UPI001B8D1F68|nr:glycine cleavage system protein H [Mobiluncus mulieris]
MKSARWVVCVLVRRVLAAFHEWLADDGGGASRSARVHEVPFEFGLNPRDLG